MLIDIRIVAAKAVLIPPRAPTDIRDVGDQIRAEVTQARIISLPPFSLAGGPTQAYLVDMAMRVSSAVS